MEDLKSRINTAYTILSGDDRPDRACKSIPDSSCTNQPCNFVLNVVNGTASKPAEQVASAKVALPWLLGAIGAPASLVGFLLIFNLARGVGSLSIQNPYVYGSIFILLGFAEAGVLLGRITFLIDQIDPAERTTYLAFANTAMGVVTLIFGFLGVLAQIVGILTLIVVLIVPGLSGSAVSCFLPESSKD